MLLGRHSSHGDISELLDLSGNLLAFDCRDEHLSHSQSHRVELLVLLLSVWQLESAVL